MKIEVDKNTKMTLGAMLFIICFGLAVETVFGLLPAIGATISAGGLVLFLIGLGEINAALSISLQQHKE